jgi:hypothetical protein
MAPLLMAPPPMRRRVILHCGQHKTGTTALQQFLRQSAPALRALGVLVPRAGRLDHLAGGHHNIAWELTRDRRYHHSFGGVADLASEIAAFDGDSVLSSEDFETALGTPGRLAPLLRHPKLSDRDFVVAVYLRDQISYAEALFIENTCHGCGEECLAVLRDIAAFGELPVREWRFQFDYANLFANLNSFRPARIVPRSYHAIGPGGIVPDFLRLLFPGLPVPAHPSSSARVKPRWTLLQALTMFYGNRVGRDVTERELAAICLLAAPVFAAPVVLPSRLRRTLAERFSAGNQALCRATGLPWVDFDLAGRVGPPAPGACLMDRVFSFESQIAIARLAELLPADMDPAVPDARKLAAPARAIILGTTRAWQTEPA